ncbi:MAG TPA: tRNA (adenosine(37)-N6)-threonylcarbamoyltransferase complex ATPase subunit type 1 TsaE [Gammaproteobacteria bacterium]|nr:tRNA (adenosine(37)-N6)-threonylcarbamoyltransferase complex ATPase subunit type 1 TsaE [Gammaproteobacteria bacterium]
MKFLYHEEDILAFAAQIANIVDARTIIFLQGPLGAGKTTFARGFLRGLGFKDKVKSPTYTLVESYDIAGRKIFHFDFYRLNRAEELRDIGIEEYFFSNAICLIEWPEKGFSLLPAADLIVDIAIKEVGRELAVTAGSSYGEAVMKSITRCK